MTTAQLLANDPFWLSVVKAVLIFAVLVLLTLFMIWFERRVIGKMQHRPGPNRAGPGGILQSLADGLKLAFKEDIRPVLADHWVYFLAPVIATGAAILAFSVVPLGGQVTLFGQQTALQLADMPVSLLVILACSSVGVYGIVLAGWSSGSPYPLLSALRSAAQVISYEIAMGLSFVGVILLSGSLSTSVIVSGQSSLWYVFTVPVSFVIYLISMVGETNRAPFDLAEAESELVGGFHTEYSSLKFALFFLGEYINMVTVSAVATTLFLGGWHAPFWLGDIANGYFDTGWWPLLWFLGKTMVLLFCFVWLRGTLPRMRYDQFMKLGWKVLVPINLIWIVAVVTMRTLRNSGSSTGTMMLIIGIVLVVVLIVVLLLPNKAAESEVLEVPLTGGGYPVPPLDLSVPKVPARAAAKTPVADLPKVSAGKNSTEEGESDGRV